MKIRRKIDGLQAMDYCKVEDVIYSCETMKQMEIARAMVHQFENIYHSWYDWVSLNKAFSCNCKRIRESNAASEETK